MKKHPRIYSLSTLGLIHHQEFDYTFHPFRTDFIGESGSGKSMIADLLQLIFVGSEAFESATQAMDDRKPEGMVLESTSKRGRSNIGYAFLNIEVQPNQYVVIGCYLDTTTRFSEAFIIQTGYDNENLALLSSPVVYTDFLKEEEILPLDLLKDHLENKNLHCTSWQRIKGYHEVLYKNQIIPLNLALSDKILKDYASILQSFSRGKILDIKKSSSLKHFLFGNDLSKEIYGKFKQAVQEIESDIGEYGHNLNEIQRVTQKQKALLELKQKKEERDNQEKVWLTRNFLHFNQIEEDLTKEVEDMARKVLGATKAYTKIEKEVNDALEHVKNELPTLLVQKEESQNLYDEIRPLYLNIKKVEDFLRKHECDTTILKSLYQKGKKLLELKTIWGNVHKILSDKKVFDIFLNIKEERNYQELSLYFSNRTEELDKIVRQKEALKKYANLTDPESLAYWAIGQNRTFTIQEESVILHFQKLPRNKPENKERYLPIPKEVFDSLNIKDQDKNGFWLNMNGVLEYIELVDKQLFNTTDKQTISNYFESYTNTLSEDIKRLDKEKSDIAKVQEVFLSFGNPNLILEAFNNSVELEKFQAQEMFELSGQEFFKLLENYENRVSIEERYTELNTKRANSFDKYKEAELYQDELKEFVKQITLIKNLAEFNNELEQITSIHGVGYRANNQLSLDQINAEKLRDKINRLKEQLSSIKSELSLKDKLLEKNGLLNDATTKRTSALRMYQNRYNTIPDDVLPPNEARREPIKDNYLNAEKAYFELFNKIIEEYIPSESYRLKDNQNFIELSRNLLPEAFREMVESESESSVIETVEHYLKSINDKNRNLNNRKVQKIRDILDLVDSSVSLQLDVVRRIDNFLKSGEKQITGGYQARLKRSFSNEYPKGWIDTFKKTIDQEIGIFFNTSSLANRLSERVDLEGMVKEAFYNCGGSKSTVTSVQKLLDPTSYYDLTFSMESASGRINKGSTGQTYAAIALLCIARLSVMSNDENEATKPSVRFMPIDEAEGLGANYDMLYDIAQIFDFQIISLSVNPVGKFKEGEQYIYMLHKNMEEDEPINYTPMAIFCEADMKGL